MPLTASSQVARSVTVPLAVMAAVPAPETVTPAAVPLVNPPSTPLVAVMVRVSVPAPASGSLRSVPASARVKAMGVASLPVRDA